MNAVSSARPAMVIPYAYAREHQIAAIADEGANVLIVVTSATPVEAIAEARRVLGKPVRVQRLMPEAFALALAQAYATQHAPQTSESAPQVSSQSAAEDLLVADSNDGPAVALVNQLLVAALNAQASDIHLEPLEGGAAARLRIDGQLRDAPVNAAELSSHYAAAVARLKVMARLDLAERRLPQDGRLTVNVGGRSVDVRISTLPCAFGERIVLRLLDKSAARLELSALGLSPLADAALNQMLTAPHGIVLVTGPTGSGKTTTLYAALGALATRARNIMTVEDPIEYAITGIAQTAVNPAIGLTFARALRAILRQDPDVILIGEIRDAETAQIAVQASLTGHLVLATLHTNDAASAVTRLMDMGIEPYLLAGALHGVIAQRLLRKLCPHCRIAAPPTEAERAALNRLGVPQLDKLYQPSEKGCAQCDSSSYRGRTGAYEAMPVSAALRGQIHANVSHATLRGAARDAGMQPLATDAARWLADGTTSLAEVLRIATDAA